MPDLRSRFVELQEQAGPRGATFAGRVTRPDESLKSVLTRFPIEPISGEELQGLLPLIGGAGAIGSGGLRKAVQGGIQKWFAAANDTVPLSPLHQMYPALINSKTGEVMVNLAQKGAGGHTPLIDSLKGIPNPEFWRRGFADPLTPFAFTETQLNKANNLLLMQRYK